MIEGLNQDQRMSTTTYFSPGFLLIFIASTATIWIAKYHWNRRHLYRLSANIPGPKSYPLIGSALKLMVNNTEELFIRINEIFDESPDLFKMWLGNSLVFWTSRPEHIAMILNSSACLNKSSFYKYLKQAVGDGLLTADAATWKRHRRMISPVFSQKLLNGFVDAFNEKSKTLLSLLDQKLEDSNLDLLEIFSTLNLDILSDTMLGVDLNEQRDETSKLNKWIDTILTTTHLRAGCLMYHSDILFNLTKFSEALNEAKTCLRNFTKKIIMEKRRTLIDQIQALLENGGNGEETEHTKKTLLQVLLLLSDKGVQFTDKEIQEELEIFIMAGTDTTAATIGFILCMLGMHPNIQNKVLEEVLDVIGPLGDIAIGDLSKLNLLERVIKETLRLFPVGVLLSRRTETDVNIGDATIPAHCDVIIGVFQVHRNEKYWKDPSNFDPDRFLPEEVAKRHPFTYLPFSAGPRNCIGYRYAMMSMKIILSKIVRRYVIGTNYKSVDEIELTGSAVLKIKNGYKVYFKLRK